MVAANTLSMGNFLANLPPSLRDELLLSYNQIVTNYRERKWEPSELNGGKLCEVVYTILRGHVDGAFPTTSSKPANMVDACRALEQAPATFPRSVRIQIPRMLIALYEIRNNRGVGHVGGEVNPNQMDATCVLYISKWIVSELVRLFHNVDTETAGNAIDAIVERVLPVVWKVGERLRVLDTTIKMKERTLLLLYHSATPLKEQELFEWVEHSNASTYRQEVLRSLHREKFIEYDENARLIHLSPKGIMHVEKNVLSKAKA
jgi:hypothetical protein